MIKEITEERYDKALGDISPSMWMATIISQQKSPTATQTVFIRFLLGEPRNQRICTVTKKVMPTYSAFFFAFGRFFESDPMTTAEFKAFKDDNLPVLK